MRTNIVFTLTGIDKIGIVEEVTELFFKIGGNVETSRMARLGGEFAILMLVALPAEHLADLDQTVNALASQGYQVTTRLTEETYADAHPGWLYYQVNVQGADHEGIIHQVAHYLSQCGINIESADTSTVRAPVSGAPLFSMTARVAVPPGLGDGNWEVALEEMGHHLNLDIDVAAVGD